MSLLCCVDALRRDQLIVVERAGRGLMRIAPCLTLSLSLRWERPWRDSARPTPPRQPTLDWRRIPRNSAVLMVAVCALLLGATGSPSCRDGVHGAFMVTPLEVSCTRCNAPQLGDGTRSSGRSNVFSSAPMSTSTVFKPDSEATHKTHWWYQLATAVRSANLSGLKSKCCAFSERLVLCERE